ncbi:SDR family oxidoreductase [Wenxinia marina]|uniref:Short-chain dehydrogenase n=1 Tax=Wenxinia marina DSM 24838 TaxID=1123501 RepID=A0A0D0PGP4_9RHOB|nr:SDR family oxidoreductase [Wenxinia marina]KIQ70516.1 Short-chain alcohol dehydrogenase of unknown specificity [Wenxinia marina DSM 24838]GGL52524.1 oxidoreductase [Wenxinia marina]
MKSILVTGASSGIGRAVAERCLDAGWRVGLLARRADRLEEIAAGREAAVPLPCDVTDADAVEAAFEAFGQIDVLFNNAGMFAPPALIDETPVETWNEVVAVNLTGMFLCARAAFARMRAQGGGRIVNNGSISAYMPREKAVTYTVTKHAITGLTRQIALDGRPLNIACGQIDIGNAATEMVEAQARRAEAAGEPAPHTMDVAHVADAVLAMAELPLSANVLFQTIMATGMPYVGRG